MPYIDMYTQNDAGLTNDRQHCLNTADINQMSSNQPTRARREGHGSKHPSQKIPSKQPNPNSKQTQAMTKENPRKCHNPRWPPLTETPPNNKQTNNPINNKSKYNKISQ